MNFLYILVLLGLGYMFIQGIIGLQSGTINARGGPFSRQDDPVSYWMNVIIFLVAPPVFLLLLFLPRH